MKFYKPEKGAAYLWVISITLIVTLLSFALIYIVTTDFKITNSTMYGVRAYYLAESGAELGVSMIYNDIKVRKTANLEIPPSASYLYNDISGITNIVFDYSNYDYTKNTFSFRKDNPFTEYNNTNHKYEVKIKTDTAGAITTYKIASKGTYKDTIIRCIYVEFNVMTDNNTYVFFPQDNNQNSPLKWIWQQISQDDFNNL